MEYSKEDIIEEAISMIDFIASVSTTDGVYMDNKDVLDSIYHMCQSAINELNSLK